jgi:hypothetical protein
VNLLKSEGDLRGAVEELEALNTQKAPAELARSDAREDTTFTIDRPIFLY